MADVEYSDSDFTEAAAQLRQAGEAASDASCPAFSVVGSTVVESALDRVDAVIRSGMDALAGVADELLTDTSTVHAELRRTDAELAGAS